jgi:hypothetical protein
MTPAGRHLPCETRRATRHAEWGRCLVARFLKRVLMLGAAVGAGYAGYRLSRSRRSNWGATRTARPFAYPSGSRGAPLHIPSQVVPPGGPEASPPGTT